MSQKDIKTNVWKTGKPASKIVESAEIADLKRKIEQQQQIEMLKKQVIEQKAPTMINHYHVTEPKPSDFVTCNHCLKTIGAVCGCDERDGCFCFAYRANNSFDRTSACKMCGHATPSGYSHKCGKCFTYYRRHEENVAANKSYVDPWDDD